MWKTQHNKELYGIFQELNVINIIKANKLRWERHAVWMKESEYARKLFKSEPVEKQECGRPWLGWIDGLVEDLRILGCRNWRMMAQNRNEWWWLFGKAVALMMIIIYNFCTTIYFKNLNKTNNNLKEFQGWTKLETHL